MHLKYILAILCILLASLMWAFESIFVKLSYQISEQDYFWETTFALRAFVVTIVAAIYIILFNKASFKISQKEFWHINYIAVVGTLLADALFVFALTQIYALNAVFIGHMQPIFVIFISLFFLKEDTPNKWDLWGVVFMIVAGLLVTSQNLTNLLHFNLGSKYDLLVVFSCFFWASTTVYMRKFVRNTNVGILTFYRFLTASIFCIIYLIYNSIEFFNNLYAVYVGFVAGIGTLFYYLSLKTLKSVQVSTLELSTSVFTIILAYIILDDTTYVQQIFGIGIMFIGVYFITQSKHSE